MAGVIAGVGLQPKWMASPQLQTSSASCVNGNGRFRIRMAVSSVDEKEKTYTVQKSEEAFSKAKVFFFWMRILARVNSLLAN